MAARPLVCRELVELVTDYLEGALAPDVHRAVADHLRRCEGCADYVSQLRSTVAALGSMAPRSPDPQVCNRLMAAFRGWSAGHDAGANGM
jgi:anti-sigma factor RsiW